MNPMYQGANSGLLDTVNSNQGDHMTTESLIAAHTVGASDALAASITRPSAGSALDVDPAAVAADIDAAIAVTRSTLGRSTRSGAALRVKA